MLRLWFDKGTLLLKGEAGTPYGKWDPRVGCYRIKAYHYRDVLEYLAESKQLLNELQKPFVVLELAATSFDVTVVVSGGGHAGQVDAIRLGIAKALVEKDENYKSTLRRAELLGRDSRERERKKFGFKGARKQRQFTKR